MLGEIGLTLINYFSWVVLGVIVALGIYRLDRQANDLIPSLISSIVGAIAGGVLSIVIFGNQIALTNLSSFFLILTGALLLGLVTKILRAQTEKQVQTKSTPARTNSYEYAYFSQISRVDHQNDIKQLLNRMEFPISSRDLVREAEKSGADRQDLTLLESLPNHIYQSKSEVLNQLNPS